MTYYDMQHRFKYVTENNFEIVKDFFWYTDFNITNFEIPQVQKYSVGQQFDEHYDFFNVDGNYVTDNDRIATMIVYLNDNFVGGETYFPKLDLSYVPKKGSAIFFEYKYIEKINKYTRHAGLPVLDGEKWIITSWIRTNSWEDESIKGPSTEKRLKKMPSFGYTTEK
jgi:hypothetical protein